MGVAGSPHHLQEEFWELAHLLDGANLPALMWDDLRDFKDYLRLRYRGCPRLKSFSWKWLDHLQNFLWNSIDSQGTLLWRSLHDCHASLVVVGLIAGCGRC